MIKKRVAELVDIERDINPYDVVALYAGVGSGKNTFIEGYHSETENVIGLAENHRVLLITSRRAKVDETKKRDNKNGNIFIKYIVETDSWNYDESRNKSVICTNAHVAKRIKETFKLGDKFTYFWNDFDYVVIDEFHSLVTDASFAESSFYLTAMIKFILTLSNKPKIILMSGTPEPAESLIQEITTNVKFNKLDLRKETGSIKPKKFQLIYKENIYAKIYGALRRNETVVYFTNHTDVIIPTIKALKKYQKKQEKIAKSIENYDDILNNLQKKTLQNDFVDSGAKQTIIDDNTAVFISKEKINETIQNDYKTIFKNSENIKDFLAKNEKLPDNIKLLITNSKAKEGININSRIDMVIIENHSIYDIAQMCGRFRNPESINCVCLVTDAEEFNSKNEYYSAEEYETQFEISNLNSYFQSILETESSEDIKNFKDYINDNRIFIKHNPFTNSFEMDKCYIESLHNLYKSQNDYYWTIQKLDSHLPTFHNDFLNYFDEDTNKLLPHYNIPQYFTPAEFLEKFLANNIIVDNENPIPVLDRYSLSTEEKDWIFVFFNIILTEYFNQSQQFVRFGDLMKFFGYRVTPSDKKSNDKTTYTLTKLKS